MPQNPYTKNDLNLEVPKNQFAASFKALWIAFRVMIFSFRPLTLYVPMLIAALPFLFLSIKLFHLTYFLLLVIWPLIWFKFYIKNTYLILPHSVEQYVTIAKFLNKTSRINTH